MTNQPLPNASGPHHFLRPWLISLFLVIMTIAIYAPVRHHDFINHDDPFYVEDNRHVQAGLTFESIKWAFSVTKSDERAYWHPLTWLSHMLDCQIFGVQPGYHHLSNLFYHLLNVLLLFLVFTRMTGAIWKSAFVAALFAVHPLNVDSVAWIAERKNLLSTTFWFSTMLAYVFYAKNPSLRRYLLVFAVLAAGLLAKPMLVTLPCVLLLMDFWPLNRTTFAWQMQTANKQFPGASLYQLIAEKIPLLILSATSTVLSVISLDHHDQFVAHDTVPMGLRLENAIVSYIKYIIKIIWPHDMAIFYPFPHSIPIWQVLGALLLLVAIFLIAFLLVRKMPFFSVGWLWFTGTLVPVIGIVQGGRWPEIADRWTYVPAIGIFIIAGWGGSAILKKISQKSVLKVVCASFVLLSLMMVSHHQVGYWKNSMTLFSHVIDVTKNNGLAHYNLGEALGEAGHIDQAISHYYFALKITPENIFAHVNLANALTQKEKLDEAVNHFKIALKYDPQNDKAYVGLGNIFAKKKRLDIAIECTLKALEINPHNAVAADNLGKLMLQQGDIDGAMQYFKKTLEINPDNESAMTNLKELSIIQKKINEQAPEILQAIRSSPNDPLAYVQLGRLYQSMGFYTLAIPRYEKALSINLNTIPALYSLGIIYALKGEYEDAIESFKKIIANDPDNASAYYNIACIYSRQDKISDAVEWLKMAVDKGYDNRNNLKTDPDLDNIREEPGYRKLIEMMGRNTDNS